MKRLLLFLFILFGSSQAFGQVAYVLGGYNSTAVTITLQFGGGSTLPAVPFVGYWWNYTNYGLFPLADPSLEKINVVQKFGDTIVVVRGYLSSAFSHNTIGKTYAIESTSNLTPIPTNSPTATFTKTATGTASPTSTKTNTPISTNTPTNTPTPGFSGAVSQVNLPTPLPTPPPPYPTVQIVANASQTPSIRVEAIILNQFTPPPYPTAAPQNTQIPIPTPTVYIVANSSPTPQIRVEAILLNQFTPPPYPTAPPQNTQIPAPTFTPTGTATPVRGNLGVGTGDGTLQTVYTVPATKYCEVNFLSMATTGAQAVTASAYLTKSGGSDIFLGSWYLTANSSVYAINFPTTLGSGDIVKVKFLATSTVTPVPVFTMFGKECIP